MNDDKLRANHITRDYHAARQEWQEWGDEVDLPATDTMSFNTDNRNPRAQEIFTEEDKIIAHGLGVKL